MLLSLLLACATKQYSMVGVVDVKDTDTCAIQLQDETIVYINSKVCTNLREGDMIWVTKK